MPFTYRVCQNALAATKRRYGCVSKTANWIPEPARNANKQVELAFGDLHLGDVHVEETDEMALKALALGFVTLDIGHTGYAVSLDIESARAESNAGSTAAVAAVHFD